MNLGDVWFYARHPRWLVYVCPDHHYRIGVKTVSAPYRDEVERRFKELVSAHLDTHPVVPHE